MSGKSTLMNGKRVLCNGITVLQTWNEEIAQKSKEWADRCNFYHRSPNKEDPTNVDGTAGTAL